MRDSAALDFEGMLATGFESYAEQSPCNGTALFSATKGTVYCVLKLQFNTLFWGGGHHIYYGSKMAVEKTSDKTLKAL